MSENDLLLSRIGQLAGQINRMKTQNGATGPTPPGGQQQQGYPQYPAYNSYNSHSSYSQYGQAYPHSHSLSTGRPGGQASSARASGAGRGSPYWIPSQRGATSYRGRGRGGRAAPAGHRHRSLVLNGGSNSGPNTPSATPSGLTPFEDSHQQDGSLSDSQQAPGSWIAKRDRHMQLINTSVYEQQAAARTKAMEKTRQEKIKRREERDKAKLKLFLLRKSAATGGTAPAQHEVVIGGARYKIGSGGSKLLKVPEDSGTPTPKSAVVGGVKFVRSKTGNLWRAGFVNVKRYVRCGPGISPCEMFMADTNIATLTTDCRNVKQHKISKPCKFFTQTGKCTRGMSCPYLHDPNRVAICPKYLQDSCPEGILCDLSHDPTPHRVPFCMHFQRGNCTNPTCKYAHVKVNPAAKICRAFTKEGYCDKGANCAEKHIYECPDYDEKGVCKDKSCKLPHIEHAARRRLAAEAKAATASELSEQEDTSDISSDEEEQILDSDDVDSDAFSEEEFLSNPTVDSNKDQEISAQQDFIKF